MHCASWAFAFEATNAGNSSAARIAMMAITHSNSISVKARLRTRKVRRCLTGTFQATARRAYHTTGTLFAHSRFLPGPWAQSRARETAPFCPGVRGFGLEALTL